MCIRDSAWDDQVTGEFNVQLRIEVSDQPGVLARVTATFADAWVNILDFQKLTSDGDSAVLSFTVQVKGIRHLDELLRLIRRVDVVQKVQRVIG